MSKPDKLLTPARCEWIPTEWAIAPLHLRPRPDVTIHRLGQMSGPDLYAVRQGNYCLSRKGGWEFEPQPSSRDRAFFRHCRFSSFEEARTAAEATEEFRQCVSS
mgnify:CR=1 FL=1